MQYVEKNAEFFERKIEGKCGHNPMVIKSCGKPDYLPVRYSRNGRYFLISAPNGEVYFPSNYFQVTASY